MPNATIYIQTHKIYHAIKSNKICHKQQLTGKIMQQIMFSHKKSATPAIKF